MKIISPITFYLFISIIIIVYGISIARSVIEIRKDKKFKKALKLILDDIDSFCETQRVDTFYFYNQKINIRIVFEFYEKSTRFDFRYCEIFLNNQKVCRCFRFQNRITLTPNFDFKIEYEYDYKEIRDIILTYAKKFEDTPNKHNKDIKKKKSILTPGEDYE